MSRSLARSTSCEPAGLPRRPTPLPSSPNCLQVCRSNPEAKGKYIKIILALLQVRLVQWLVGAPCSTCVGPECGRPPGLLEGLHQWPSRPPQVQQPCGLPVPPWQPATQGLRACNFGCYVPCPPPRAQSRSTAVVYECAVTLVSLSSAPTAVRAAANCFCQLLVSQSDNNVRLIVLDRLQVRPRGGGAVRSRGGVAV